jgi:hypothetical protein
MKRERRPMQAAVAFFIIYMIVCGWIIMLACSPEVFLTITSGLCGFVYYLEAYGIDQEDTE